MIHNINFIFAPFKNTNSKAVSSTNKSQLDAQEDICLLPLHKVSLTMLNLIDIKNHQKAIILNDR